MPQAFFFARGVHEAPGAYSRCASFDTGRAAGVALSPDGRLAALVGGDGVARVIDVASSTVVAALAPPRASIGSAAFSPAGDAVLTVAPGEREVTLWRTADWTPVWTTSLPGQRYLSVYPHAAFASDGRSVAVSPGSGLFVLDVATGAVRASRTTNGNVAIFNLAYAWGGRRLVDAEVAFNGDCVLQLDGGDVFVLSPDTLQVTADLVRVNRNLSDDPGLPYPRFAASPTDDLVLTSGTAVDPGPWAVRASDGGRLPPPAVAHLPLAFLPDGARVLVADGGVLDVARLDDGTTVVGGAPPTPVDALAISADGHTVALAGDGSNLLRVWDAATGTLSATCSADDRDGVPQSAPDRLPSDVSADGQLVALGWGSQILMIRRADGARIGVLAGTPGTSLTSFVRMSDDGRYAIVGRQGGYPLAALFRTTDGELLSSSLPPLWTNPQFSPDGRALISVSDGSVESYDLASSQTTVRQLPMPANQLVAISGGCPVVYDQTDGMWRSCDRCDDPPFAADTKYGPTSPAAVASPGGEWLATRSGAGATATVKLWRMSDQPELVASWAAARPADSPWQDGDVPRAITPDGRRLVLDGAPDNYVCYFGPSFETVVRDTATGAVVDTLPPNPTGIDDQARTFLYGGQMWCAR
jgi:WD40 repeat protein